MLGPRVLWYGVYDALSARVVYDFQRSSGAEHIAGVWLSSFCVSASLKACPDASLVSWSEMLELARRVDAASGALPVVLDCDCGYGDSTVFAYFVEELCRTSDIAGICVEDKVFPKRNSFYDGFTQVLQHVDEFTAKVTAAKNTARRIGHPLKVVARTEALVAGCGVDEAVERLRLFAKAGADGLMVQSTGPLDELMAVAQAWSRDPILPLVVVPTAYPELAPVDFWDGGWSVFVYANQLLRRAGAVQEASLRVLTDPTYAIGDSDVPMWPFTRINDLVDLQQLEHMEASEELRRTRGGTRG